ncbi:hypothetical protein CAPTEDRAFT_199767 [Capitella teleta]|uniref:Uncharacterized protein n=1 Tax=Capitella teleta TaxID=283909 RepID=R7U006_CAPTE|nr:hypothetical protein CAPTEDRAFT_199767 [Capitella teleta]|eukprot:ELT96996.1 hypothetical protein CAPTEDRAFT_199767 [Capitella teleta]
MVLCGADTMWRPGDLPPERPSISLNQSTSDLYEGDFLLFECSSNGGNPTPNFRWSREGIYLSESSGGISDAKFGVSRSYLVRQLTKDDHAATFGCDVENEANPGSPEEIALFINVMYAPIVDFGDFNPLVVLDRDDVTLTCNVDAYPAIPANNVIWKKDQEFLGSGFTYLITEIRPSNAGAYTCTASNHAETRAILQVDVQYAPLLSPSFNAGVITGSRVEIKENQSLNVTCSVDANPAVASADIVWKKAGDGEVHRGAVLSFARVNRAHAGEYTCEASNTLRPSGKPAGTGFGTVDVTIIVLYAPGKASVSVPSSVISGQPASLRCSVDVAGVPSADLVWTRLDNGAQLGTGPTYDISATALSDNGDYVCTPANSMGDGVPDTARLDVSEIPQWLLALPTKRTVIISQTDIGLTCRVRGRPVPQLTWYKNGLALDFSPGYYDLTEQQESIDVHSWNLTSTLKFRGFDRYPELGSLRKEDAGNYTCVAGNGLEEAALVSSVLFAVHYPPEVKADAEKVAIDENQSATLVCESHAVPTPTFMWYNGTTPLVTGGRVSIKALVVDGEYQYRTELTIDDVAEHDLGDYRCAASNVLGERGVSIHLTVQTVPEAPYNLSVVSSTWESVQLKWEAGFNGGYPQTFKIKYQTSDSVADVGSATASKYNVSNLMPSTNYTFFIYGLNQLGDGDFSKSISSTTSAFAIDPPMEVYYDVAKRHLMYQSPSTNLCARVEIHQGKDSWDQYVECADPTSGSIEIDSDWNILNIRVALCLIRRPEVCSEQQMAFIDKLPCLQSMCDLRTYELNFFVYKLGWLRSKPG